jgi:hypothetical protein
MSFRTRPSMAQYRLAIKNRQSRTSLTLIASTNPTSRRAHFILPSLSKRGIAHAAREMALVVVALTFASVAHAQGTMDFSDAQTLMGTFN